MDSFTEECIKLYEDSIKTEIIKQFDKTYTFTEQTIKSNIMNELKDSSNYDYRKLPNFSIFMNKLIKSNCAEAYHNHTIGNHHYKPQCTTFLDEKIFIPNEKIACIYINSDTIIQKSTNVKLPNLSDIIPSLELNKYQTKDYYFNNCHFSSFIIITNYGKVYYNDTLKKEYNIWLPLDYINLINIMKPANIIEVMDNIISKLYLKTYNNTIDNTIHKIQIENNDLIIKNNKLEEELMKLKEEFNSIKQKYHLLDNKFNQITKIISSS